MAPAPARFIRILPDDFIVAIGGSGSGGLQDVQELLKHLPSELAVIVLVVLHRPADEVSYLRELLEQRSAIPVRIARNGEWLKVGHCYVGEPGQQQWARRAHRWPRDADSAHDRIGPGKRTLRCPGILEVGMLERAIGRQCLRGVPLNDNDTVGARCKWLRNRQHTEDWNVTKLDHPGASPERVCLIASRTWNVSARSAARWVVIASS
jgi:hypothetical protein